MDTPRAPLPKRRPLRTREEILEAGRQRSRGARLSPELGERLAMLLTLAHPAKPVGAKPGPG